MNITFEKTSKGEFKKCSLVKLLCFGIFTLIFG